MPALFPTLPGGERIKLIDTAGIRKRTKVRGAAEQRLLQVQGSTWAFCGLPWTQAHKCLHRSAWQPFPVPACRLDTCPCACCSCLDLGRWLVHRMGLSS